mgnify:FL=1
MPVQDPVPRIPKFLYKRCGHRVTITEAGDIIVRPSYFELSVLTKSGKPSACVSVLVAGTLT